MLIVTAAIIQSGEKVLIARRNPMLSNGGRWEFPGGKVKPGEDPRSCLRREIREELGIEITVLDKLGTITHAENQRTLKLLFYRSNWTAGLSMGKKSRRRAGAESTACGLYWAEQVDPARLLLVQPGSLASPVRILWITSGKA